jgi:hypothetical protein
MYFEGWIMGRTIRTAFFTGGLFVLLIGFQNCSAVKFSPTPTASDTKANSAAGTNASDTTALPQTSVPPLSTPSPVAPAVAAVPPAPVSTTMSTPGSRMPASVCTSDCDGKDDKDDIDDKDKDSEDGDSRMTAADYRAACAGLASSHLKIAPLQSGVSLENISGDFGFKTGGLLNINNVSGHFSILDDGTGSGKIGHIKDTAGNLLICGFQIGEMNGLSGDVVIVDGSVQVISSASGNVKLVGSTVGTVRDLAGHLSVVNVK